MADQPIPDTQPHEFLDKNYLVDILNTEFHPAAGRPTDQAEALGSDKWWVRAWDAADKLGEALRALLQECGAGALTWLSVDDLTGFEQTDKMQAGQARALIHRVIERGDEFVRELEATGADARWTNTIKQVVERWRRNVERLPNMM